MTRSSLRSIDRQVLSGFAVALVILVAVIAYARGRVAAVDDAMRSVDHTHLVLENITAVRARLVEAQSEHRAYFLTRDTQSLAGALAAARSVDSSISHLRALTSDNPVQLRRVDTLQSLAREELAELGEQRTRADARRPEAARDAMSTRRERATMDQLNALSGRLGAEERRLLAQRTARHTREQRAARGAVLLGALALFVLAVLSTLRARSALVVRARAEQERDEHAHALLVQSRDLEAQNEELMAQSDALQLAMAQADGANHAKSMFLAQMSHELRTPLNSVIGFAHIVRRNPRGTLNEADLTYLDRIAENGRQLLRTINSILDLSKIEAEQESVELEMVALQELVSEVLGQMEPQAAAGTVELIAEVPAPLASIVTDTEKLRRVLINLVANAVKFTRPGGRVVVRVETAPRARTTPIAIEVRDTGVGIAPERLAMIFEAFEQGDVGVGREYGGTGLGLSISRALCRLLDCELTVSSELGKGSTFRVALPLKGALASLPPMSDVARARSGASASPLL